MNLSTLKMSLVAALAALLFALPAHAENYWHQPMEGAWQMSGAGEGGFLLGIELGSQREKINFYKALSSVDIGAYFQYNVDLMDLTNHYWDYNGIQVGMNLRFKLMDSEKWNLALNIDPGFDMYWADWGHYLGYDYDIDQKLLGVNVNLRLVAGIKIVDRFRVHAGIVIPLEIFFASTGDDKFDKDEDGDSIMPWVSMPVLLNGGAEFKILPWLSVMADLRLGPGFKFGNMVDANDDHPDDRDDLNSGAWFVWEAHAGVAFRF